MENEFEILHKLKHWKIQTYQKLNKIMINLNRITSNSKSQYTKIMYFAHPNLLLYGKPQSSYHYVVQAVIDMFDKHEHFSEVSFCQYNLHVNNIHWKMFVGLGSSGPTLSVVFFIPGECLPVNSCNISSGWIFFYSTLVTVAK